MEALFLLVNTFSWLAFSFCLALKTTTTTTGKKKKLGEICIPVRAGVGVGKCKQDVKLSKGAGSGGLLEWAEVLTLPQKPQAPGFLDAKGK